MSLSLRINYNKEGEALIRAHRVSGTWHPTHSIYVKLLVSRVPDRE